MSKTARFAKTLFAATAALAMGAGVANATEIAWNYGFTNGSGGGSVGHLLTDLDITYAETGGRDYLAFSAGFKSEILNDDGFYLVVNGGPNPKNTATELAILYGDIANNRITAYRYDGRSPTAANPDRRDKSWGNESFYISTFEDAMSITDKGYSFNLDVTAINSLFGGSWTGVEFANKLGIWYGFFPEASFSYDANNRIDGLKTGAKGWKDTTNLTTHKRPICDGSQSPNGCYTPPTDVSEPGTLLIGATGLLALGGAARVRRRRKAA